MDTKDHEKFIMGALVGGAVGAAAALLLTPYSGSDIRKKVRKSLHQFNGNKIKEHAQEIANALHKKPKKKQPVKRKVATRKHN